MHDLNAKHPDIICHNINPGGAALDLLPPCPPDAADAVIPASPRSDPETQLAILRRAPARPVPADLKRRIAALAALQRDAAAAERYCTELSQNPSPDRATVLGAELDRRDTAIAANPALGLAEPVPVPVRGATLASRTAAGSERYRQLAGNAMRIINKWSNGEKLF
ncbi:MAG: hypothetical protein PHQ27_11415 [Victivallales bacterium]|nr:hypothetical protein [Victivallales bacterium]